MQNFHVSVISYNPGSEPIEFVQFEHNVKKEYWRPLHREHRSLSTVVARLYTMGYTCFILARHFIAPISAPSCHAELQQLARRGGREGLAQL